MTEFIVDKATNLVKSTHVFPMKFSISGKYIINVPGFLTLEANTNSVSDLLTKKVDAFKTEYGNLPNVINDEFINTPNVDTTQSSGITIGPQKRTSIFPTGVLVTNTFNIAVATSSVYSHWHAYLLSCKPSLLNPPGPDELLHGFDLSLQEFEEFEPESFIVEIRNSTNTATIATLTDNEEQDLVLSPGNYRLRFTNNSTKVYFMSDWIILHD